MFLCVHTSVVYLDCRNTNMGGVASVLREKGDALMNRDENETERRLRGLLQGLRTMPDILGDTLGGRADENACAGWLSKDGRMQPHIQARKDYQFYWGCYVATTFPQINEHVRNVACVAVFRC